jgi:hypothetical protein
VNSDRDTVLAALDPIRRWIGGHLGHAVSLPPASAAARVVATFGLSEFERDALLLAAGAEMDTDTATAIGRASNQPAQYLPTIGLALGRLPCPAWDAFAPDRPLRRYLLIELLPGSSFAGTAYRVPERVLQALLGIDTIEAGLHAYLHRPRSEGLLTDSHRSIATGLAAIWSADARAWPTLVLAGDDTEAKHAIAARVADAVGLRAFTLDATLLPDVVTDRDRLARMWEREAALTCAVLVLTLDDDIEPAKRRTALHWLGRMRGAAMVVVRERVRIPQRLLHAVDVERPPPRDQRDLWCRALGPRKVVFNGKIDRIVEQFSLDGSTIARLGAMANDADALWEQVRRDARPGLDELAERLPTTRSWGELVLPSALTDTLHQIVAQVRNRSTVYETWGFGRDSRGLGVTALFSGPSGVGKTLAAEVVAHQLRLDLYRIDLSQVVSKYIGETEKNLRRVFDAADSGGVVLLFDEADALFGKRTEVHDGIDRYANVEVSYLLQRMESYRGLAVLTTNFKTAIDSAFLRRLRFVVNFPLPAPVERERIWQVVFPPQMPRDGLDPKRLSQLNVAGGSIRTIALNAAFIAADACRGVTMADVLRAARTEYTKLEQTLNDAEIAGWQ